MAIQHRRGNYADFDPTKMVAGEPAVVLGGDPTSSDGKAAYIAFGPGSVKKLATAEDMQDIIYNQTQSIIQEIEESVADDVQRAEDAAESVSSSAAQIAQNTQDISNIKADLSELEPGLSDDAKTALLNCFEHVAWVDEHGQNYYNALANALYPSPVSISAVFAPGQNKIYDTDSLDDLKQYLTVTGTYTDGSTREINDYVLSGTLAHGTSTVTVTKDDKTTTFNVTVEYLTVEWNYTDGIPTANGFLEYSNAGTTQMTANGYSIAAQNATDKSYRFCYPWANTDSLYTKVIIEWKFIIDAFGSYNTSPYMNGIRIAPGFGDRGGTTLKGPNFVLNTSGLTSWHPKEGSQYYCEIINAYNFEVGQEYTVKLELDTEGCKIYINGVFITTDAYENFPEDIRNCIWGVSRGASITVKSYKEQRGVS